MGLIYILSLFINIVSKLCCTAFEKLSFPIYYVKLLYIGGTIFDNYST